MKILSFFLMGMILLFGLSLYALVWCAAAAWEALARLWAGAPVDVEVRYPCDDAAAARRKGELFGLKAVHGRGFSARPLPAGRAAGWTRARHARRLRRTGGVIEVTERGRLGYLDAVSSHVLRIFSLGA